jgi:DNA-binding NtrC family response regulator
MSKSRILLVDDDDGLRTALRRALEREGHEVVEASNGRHALDRLKETTVNLVITDIIMPESEGIELALILHKTQPELPVIAISGGGNWTAEFHLSIAKKAGALHAFEKPFAVEALLKRVDELLQKPGRTD